MRGFVAKLQISLKECYETGYRLILALKAGIVSEESVKPLLHDCGAAPDSGKKVLRMT